MLCMLLLSLHAASQDNRTRKGNYFTSNGKSQWAATIKPWRYFYQPSTSDSISAGPYKMGTLLFWRSSPVVSGEGAKVLWPRIEFDVYEAKDSITLKQLASQIKMQSDCTGPNKGGDYLPLGQFILYNAQACVKCAYENNIDYCRHIIKQVLAIATKKSLTHWPTILTGMPIAEEQPNP